MFVREAVSSWCFCRARDAALMQHWVQGLLFVSVHVQVSKLFQQNQQNCPVLLQQPSAALCGSSCSRNHARACGHMKFIGKAVDIAPHASFSYVMGVHGKILRRCDRSTGVAC